MRTWLLALILLPVLLAACGTPATRTVEKIVRVPCPPAPPTIRCSDEDPDVKGRTLEQGDAEWSQALRVCRAEVRLWREGFAECTEQ